MQQAPTHNSKYLPEALQLVVCAHLSLVQLARLATVSRLWAATYKAHLLAEQQRLKAVVAEAPPDHYIPLERPGSAPHQSLLDALPTHLPDSSTPLSGREGYWTSGSPGIFLNTWPDSWQRVPLRLRSGPVVYWSKFRFGSSAYPYSGFRVFWFPRNRRCQREHFSVDALVDHPEDMDQLLGLLLVWLQDLLPHQIQDRRHQSGKLLPSPTVDIECFLRFKSGGGMWAPLAPLLREVVFSQVGSSVESEQKGSVVFSAGKPQRGVAAP